MVCSDFSLSVQMFTVYLAVTYLLFLFNMHAYEC